MRSHPTFHECIKPDEIDYHYAHEKLVTTHQKLSLLSHKNILANIFTKLLPTNHLFSILS